jgi:hypothetical protein
MAEPRGSEIDTTQVNHLNSMYPKADFHESAQAVAFTPSATETPATDFPPKRKGSVFADQSHRKESVAALTENVTGE